jgi:hypothetical protein
LYIYVGSIFIFIVFDPKKILPGEFFLICIIEVMLIFDWNDSQGGGITLDAKGVRERKGGIQDCIRTYHIMNE